MKFCVYIKSCIYIFYNKLIQLIEEVTEMERQINKMSAKNRDAVIWARNEEWYTINKEKKRFAALTGCIYFKRNKANIKYKNSPQKY